MQNGAWRGGSPPLEKLRAAADYYLAHHIGNLAYSGDPRRSGDGWCLPLNVRGYPGTYGRVVLTAEGEVVEAQTTSLMEVLEALDAASSEAPAAG